jgi:hypothetical protein
VKALLGVAIAAGIAVVGVSAATLAGDPVERPGLVAVLAAGMLLAELFPIRVPGREEEVSFSTSFTFALLVTGLIRPPTSWVLRAALADQARWTAGGLRVAVAANLSARVLHADLVEEVARSSARTRSSSRSRSPPRCRTLRATWRCWSGSPGSACG